MAPAVLPTTVPTPGQWLFPPAALARTPSRADGLSLQAELDGRKEACTFAARLSMTLRQGPTMYECAFIQGTASLFIHRFYMRNSLKDYPPKVRRPGPLARSRPSVGVASRRVESGWVLLSAQG